MYKQNLKLVWARVKNAGTNVNKQSDPLLCAVTRKKIVPLNLHICMPFSAHFYMRKQLLLSALVSHHNSVCLFVCPSVTRVDQSKTVQARITKSSPSAAWKILVSGTVKLFHKFEGGRPKRGC